MKLPIKTRKSRKIKRIVFSYGIVYSSAILMLYGFLNINNMTGNTSLVSGLVILSMYLMLKFFNDKKMKTLDRGLVESLR